MNQVLACLFPDSKIPAKTVPSSKSYCPWKPSIQTRGFILLRLFPPGSSWWDTSHRIRPRTPGKSPCTAFSFLKIHKHMPRLENLPLCETAVSCSSRRFGTLAVPCMVCVSYKMGRKEKNRRGHVVCWTSCLLVENQAQQSIRNVHAEHMGCVLHSTK